MEMGLTKAEAAGMGVSHPAMPWEICSWRAALLLVALAATAVVTPMFFLGNASGHDFQFHLASWLDVAGQWHEGTVFPRWAEWSNWGSGEPRFVFYPPASWLLGAALGVILPWRMAPGAFIWLTLIGAGMAMWRLAREWLCAQLACAAAVFFAVNPYHLVMVYYRSDFAELLASSLLPLMVWGALGVLRHGWRRVPLLAMVFAVSWLSNAPAGVIATYSLVLLFAVGCVLERSLRPLVTGGAALAVGFGLAAFYILPAAWEQRWVQITQALSGGLHPGENFLFTHANDPEFVIFNWKVSAVALGVMLISGIAGVLASRHRRAFPQLWWMLVALGAASVLLMFPPSLMIWRHLPKLQFVQFPWRWLEPLSVAFAFFLAAAAGRGKKGWGGPCAVWLIVLILLGSTATAIVRNAWWDSEDIPLLRNGIRSGRGYEGTDEYAPIGCDRYELPGAATDSGEALQPPAPRIAKLDPDSGEIVPAKGARLHVERWTAERKMLTTESATPGAFVLRLLNYPAWEVQLDGEETQASSVEKTGQMILNVPSGSHRIDVSLRRTWDRTLGGAISAFSALLLLIVGWFFRERHLSGL
jgi:hypothetical protein